MYNIYIYYMHRASLKSEITKCESLTLNVGRGQVAHVGAGQVAVD